jgi:hypothetical protein
LKLYLIEQGIQLLACLNCPFDVIDGQSPELVLNKVRQVAERDRREHLEHKKHVIVRQMAARDRREHREQEKHVIKASDT